MPNNDSKTSDPFSLSHYSVNYMNPTPLVHITDDLYEIINQQTAVFRMLYMYFYTQLTDKDCPRDYREIVIEYFQHICFQMSLMQKPATPTPRCALVSLANDDLEDILENSEKICNYLGELTDTQRKCGITAFTTFLEEEQEDPVAPYLHPALSGQAPLSKFFKPVVKDFMLETIKADTPDEGLGDPSPTPSSTTEFCS